MEKAAGGVSSKHQFPNYDRYDAATFSEAHKAEVRNTQFPVDLDKAYELGKHLVGLAQVDISLGK